MITGLKRKQFPISNNAKNLLDKKEDHDLRRKHKIRHSPFIAKLKEVCGRLNYHQKRCVLFLREHQTAFFIRFVKTNLARFGVVACALFVSIANINSKNGTIFTDFLSSREEAAPLYNKIEKSKSLALATIADAYEMTSASEYEEFLKEEGEKHTVLGALVPVSNPTPEEFRESGDDVFVYKVQDGDTASSIAQKYSITVKTVLWANDLSESSVIKPGDEIFILPITGIQHTVKQGDTVKSLAKKYKSSEEKIIAFNELPADGKLQTGTEIIIPDGQGEDAVQPARPTNPGTNTVDDKNQQIFSKKYYAYPAHKFPYGWCTWYVASRRHVPWGGNAGTWLYHAKSYGAATGKSPKVGAIMVTGESRWGHVAIVEKVSGDQITVSEMNYKGWAVKSSRTMSSKSGVIKGFIY